MRNSVAFWLTVVLRLRSLLPTTLAFQMEGPRRLTASTAEPLVSGLTSRLLTARLVLNAALGSVGCASRKLLRGHTAGSPSSISCAIDGSTPQPRSSTVTRAREEVIHAGVRRPARPTSPARELQRPTTGTRSGPGRYQTSSAGTLASDIGWLERAAVTEKVYQRSGDYVTDLLKHAGEPPLHSRPPSEVDRVMANLALRGEDLIPPIRGKRVWSVLLRSQELEVPTKTGEYDDTAIWNVKGMEFMEAVFGRLRNEKKLDKIWTLDYLKLLSMLKACAVKLQVEGLVPCSLRHSATSHDALHKLRTLQEIQKRGRWRAHQSVTRYEKGGQIWEYLELYGASLKIWLLHPEKEREPPRV